MKRGKTGTRSRRSVRRALEDLARRFEDELARGTGDPVVARVERNGFFFLLSRVPSEPVKSLTPRQRQVARLAGQGLPLDAIAERLSLSRSCVAKHLQQVYGKLNVDSRAGLARLTMAIPDDGTEG